MAVQKRFYVALDIKRPTANRDFEVVEGDNGNVLEIELTDDGTAVDLAGCLVVAVFSKSDGAAQQDSDGHGISVDVEQHNKLTISLYSTSVAPGLVECELQVLSGEDHATLVTSAKFNFMCRRGIANGDVVQATEEWPLLVDALQRCEAVEEAEEARVIVEAGRAANEDERQQTEVAREAFADKWRDMQLSVTGLPHTAAPTANVTEEETRFSVSLGIPQGEPGMVNTHVHGNITNNGKIGSTAGFVMTDEDGDIYSGNAATARAAMGAAVQSDMTALLNAATPSVTAGTAPNYLLAHPLSNFAKPILVRFHAAATSEAVTTLNINGIGAFGLFTSAGKYFIPKQYQIAWVVLVSGTGFFVVNAGGGLDIPEPIQSGDIILYALLEQDVLQTYISHPSPFRDAPTGWGFTANKAGTYRVYYARSSKGRSSESDHAYFRLTKNGAEIPGTFYDDNVYSLKYLTNTIDLALNAGDTIKIQTYLVGQYAEMHLNNFKVTVAAPELQDLFATILTPA